MKLGLAEAIRCGVTTVADYMQLQPVKGLGKLELDIAKDMGVRMVYGQGYRDIGKKELVEKAEDVFADVTALKEEFEGDGMYLRVAGSGSWLGDRVWNSLRPPGNMRTGMPHPS
ncbi:MAG: hypothetical protein ACLTBV_07625 [Enterocloster bolteae]